MIVGDPYSFKPWAWFENPQQYSLHADSVPTVTGTIVYINEAHRYFRVRYCTESGCIGHECFKF